MLDYPVLLKAREPFPLARTLRFTKGDTRAYRLVISFTDEGKMLGGALGDYATLAIQRPQDTAASIYMLTRDEQGRFLLEMSAAMVAQPGNVQCTATLYDQLGQRLTVGRFLYAVTDDTSLPEDEQLSAEQVGLVQQALGAVALMRDGLDQASDEAARNAAYAKEQGDYAKEWGSAAQEVAEQKALTWDTLPGKPETFPPAPHSHQGGGGSALVDKSLFAAAFPDVRDSAYTTLLDYIVALYGKGQLCAYFTAYGQSDCPRVTHAYAISYMPISKSSLLVVAGETITAEVYTRVIRSGAWIAPWNRLVGSGAHHNVQFDLAVADWQPANGHFIQYLNVPGLRPGDMGQIGLRAGTTEAQRQAARSGKLGVDAVEDDWVTVAADGVRPSEVLPVVLNYITSPEG